MKALILTLPVMDAKRKDIPFRKRARTIRATLKKLTKCKNVGRCGRAVKSRVAHERQAYCSHIANFGSAAV